MWEKIFSSTLGRVVGTLALVLLGFFGTIILQFWHTNVASPEYVNQRVDERAEEIRIQLSIEDQDIRKDMIDVKNQMVNNQGLLVDKLGELKEDFKDSEQDRVIFQTQVFSDLNYLKGSVAEIKEVQKETIQRVRNLETK
jgi:hypothetical protein